MDAFKTHSEVISNYKKYLQSFLNIQDQRIREKVDNVLSSNTLIPDPLIQFNPSFQKSENLSTLISEKLLNPALPKTIGDYQLFKHQTEAIRLGVANKGFVVTSGTGSGKSLTFLATIFNAIFNAGNEKKKGVKAILVYPMNALINSQEEEIKKYKINYLENFIGSDKVNKENKTLDEIISVLESRTDERFPVTFNKFTGQESGEKRELIKNELPDIILTNYMMLELIMTRQSENWFRESIKESLQYLVYDELHTYRGRQGADVSYLNKRIQANCIKDLICIGTSATMASAGSPEDKKTEVAKVASILFGKKFEKDQIINEYLETCTAGNSFSSIQIKKALEDGIDDSWEEQEFINHPITNWLELNIALKDNHGTLERGKPLSADEISAKLSELSGKEISSVKNYIISLLKWTEKLNEKYRKDRRSYLPFRFHQFISQTGIVSVTLESKDERVISLASARYHKEKNGDEKLLYPILFSRYSGVEFICVEKNTEDQKLIPVNPDKNFTNISSTQFKDLTHEVSEKDFSKGYIVLHDPELFQVEEDVSFYPVEWLNKKGTELDKYHKWLIPQKIYFDVDGSYSDDPIFPFEGYFIPAKLRIDPTAGVIYEDSKTSEFTKLTRIGNEGRSTATTVLSYSVIDTLFEQKEKSQNQKLLSFTDNRQDASLQAGHFNDFLSSVKLRTGLRKALFNNPSGLNIHEIGERVFDELNLKEAEYAAFPSTDPDFPDDENIRAAKDYILYRILQDLKYGWRYTVPNLEQTALLKLDFKNLTKLSGMDNKFTGITYLSKLTTESRRNFLFQVVNYFRTHYAINHRMLINRQETETFLKNKLDQNKLWSLDRDEKIEASNSLVTVKPRTKIHGRFFESMGVRSILGRYINRKLIDYGEEKLNTEKYNEFIIQVCDILKAANILMSEELASGEIRAYQLRSDSIIWLPGDEKIVIKDETRLNTYKDFDLKPNMFFQDLYKVDFSKYSKEIVGREHTGQLSSSDRITREEEFRKGDISTLYCSPTMELGIDIADLNIVHMRNVPPNPANYAQRSGRAGRSGQTAVVFTYCSALSPHDQNYFKAADTMVAGSVIPPRIDLLNEELLSTHFNSWMLMNLGISDLRTSVADVLDLSDERKVRVKQSTLDQITNDIEINKDFYIKEFTKVIEHLLPELNSVYWFSDKWVTSRVHGFTLSFENAFSRWITLFQNACTMRDKAQHVIDNHIIKSDSPEKNDAKKQEGIARRQIALLKNDSKSTYSNESEFYVFRYLAAEGFLPGYNFTRLPVRTFLGYAYKDEGEYLSRPRSLALREFGPGNIVYHNGSKYRITRMAVPDTENLQRKIKISKDTGFAFLDEDAANSNIDPITKTELKGEAVEFRTNLIEVSESEGIPTERISCIEEERAATRYEISEYFRYTKGIEHTKSLVISNDGHKMLRLIYDQATELIKLNRKMRRSQNEGFKINKTNGIWVRDKDKDKPETAANTKEVMIFARDTADTLYIQPLSNLDLDHSQTVSLSYALKRGIEKIFQVEENEIGVSVLGNPEKPNILIYESSEGSLGILSQIVQEPGTLKRVFEESYRSLHFDPETRQETEQGKATPKASYKDLLSYYNQIHHSELDRYSIQRPLEKLIDCEFSVIQGDNDRDEQFQLLLDTYDKNSGTELKLLKYLYENGYALPDNSQHYFDDYYISADFVYKTADTTAFIFCDGSVHDLPEVIADDEKKRKLLHDAGFDILVWHYAEPVADFVNRRRDIFRKIY